VTGRVYNGDNEVPYDLPANATQSGIKSRSSKGGGPANFNEIRMEDKKGEEELYIHAERNHTQITEADKSESVGNDRSKSVTRDQSEKVGRDKEIIVEGKHTETITGDTKITVQDGNYRCDVNTGRMDVVSKSQMYLESKDSIMLKVGGSSITITPAGITISATAITVDAGASLELLAGAAITENAPSVEITADAMAKVESTVVDVNGSAAVTIKGASVSVN
jgi:type VI secretion system secreted protein VgrG